MSHFGTLIRLHRKRRLLTQADLVAEIAKHPDITEKPSRAGISHLESGDVDSPRLARAVIKALHRNEGFRQQQLQNLAMTYLSLDTLETDSTDSPAAKTVGLLVPSVDQSNVWGKIAGAIEVAAGEQSCFVVICQHRDSITQQLRLIRNLAGLHAVDGLIVAPAVDIKGPNRFVVGDAKEVFESLRRDYEIPIVFIDRTFPTRTAIPYVGLDNVAAGRMAAKFLHEEGNRRIGALFSLRHASPQVERHMGFERQMREYDLYNPRWVEFGEEVPEERRLEDRAVNGIRQGRKKARELLGLPESGTCAALPENAPTALFCATSYLAIEVIKALRAAHVPPDAWPTVLGFDNVDELDNTERRELPRIAYDLTALAENAVSKLVELIEDPNDKAASQPVLIPPFIPPRYSAKPRSHGR